MNKLLIIFIILVASFFRFYNLNWDQGFHLHPDERALVISLLPLQMPQNLSDFFSPQSPLNPHFFAYGSFPIYLLKLIGRIVSNFNPLSATYDHINLIGRTLSGIFDICTLIVIFLLGKKLFSEKVGLAAGFFYSISVLPIQLSHFFAVDTFLTFFVTLTLYILIHFYEKPTRKKAIFLGCVFGLALATKNSALPLIVAIGTALVVDFFLIFFKNLHHPHIWLPHIPKLIKTLFIDGLIITAITIVTFILFEPYAIIDFATFWRQTLEQYQMTHNAFTFPYTLQYVDKTPYLYELKNIFLWGLGPILSTLSLMGLAYVIFLIIKKKKEDKWAQEFILLIFFLIYFAVVGSFSIGFMRYMLPLYPLLALFAAAFFSQFANFRIFKKTYFHLSFFIFHFSFLIFILMWPVSFLYIYSKPTTRVLASNWINQNIMPGQTIAIEHWDDGIPLFGMEKYNVKTLTLYDADTTQKWLVINQILRETDYIIIASNRLYTPLQKLTNCEKLPPFRCYKQTAKYYQDLFGEKLGFKKVAEFSMYPQFQISNFKFQIDDSSADESFTVYDHPKVMIFQKK